MKNFVKSCIGLAVFVLSSVPAHADMLSKTYVYDQKAGTFTILVMGPVNPSDAYSIDLDLNYEAANALFSGVSFSASESTSISATNVNGQGEVHASALNVKSEGGGLVAKVNFSVEGPPVFKGEITSLKINGAEFGPLALPQSNGGNDAAGAVPDSGVATPLAVPPVQVFAVGKNHAVQVLWSHPEDAVLYYQVAAHRVVNDTTSPLSMGRVCVAPKGQNTCTIRGLKNGVTVAVVATAVYPNGAAKVSETSNFVMPQMLRRIHGVIQ
jgi:hypothetical protein